VKKLITAITAKYLLFVVTAAGASTYYALNVAHIHAAEPIVKNATQIDIMYLLYKADQDIQQARHDLKSNRTSRGIALTAQNPDAPNVVSYRQELEVEKEELTSRLDQLLQTKSELEQRRLGLK